MDQSAQSLLAKCSFPSAGSDVRLAVSGGPDSLSMLLLCLEAGLNVTVHHVDHHARPTSTSEAQSLEQVCGQLKVPFVLHDVTVEPGENFEARARLARRRALPADALTGHTMDDVVETMLLNLMRGAGRAGLSPMLNNPTKPLVGVRRSDLHEWLATKPFTSVHDESNDDIRFRRNHVRHELLPLMCKISQRDVVPIMFRQAVLMGQDEEWLSVLTSGDLAIGLTEADCRELKQWPLARQRRWLRFVLSQNNDPLDTHPPSSDEVERALAVLGGEVTACELSEGRRLSRTGQRLTLS